MGKVIDSRNFLNPLTIHNSKSFYFKDNPGDSNVTQEILKPWNKNRSHHAYQRERQKGKLNQISVTKGLLCKENVLAAYCDIRVSSQNHGGKKQFLGIVLQLTHTHTHHRAFVCPNIYIYTDIKNQCF